MDEVEFEVRRTRREEWGCDRETEKLQFYIGCPTCPERDPRPWCLSCKGEGRIPVHRCPHALVRGAPVDVCQAVILAEAGLLPAPGGWSDQAAVFMDAMRVVMAEKATHDEERRKRAMREANRKR